MMLDVKWIAVGDAIQFLAEYGSSVTLIYDSDGDYWGVEWITGGVRFTANASDLMIALTNVVKRANGEDIA